MQKQFILACALVFSGFIAQAQAPSTGSTASSAQPKAKTAAANETITSGQGRTKPNPATRAKKASSNNDSAKTVQISKANGSTIQLTKIKAPKMKKTEPKVTRIHQDREKQ